MNYVNIYTFLPKCEEISEMCTAWSKEKIRKYLVIIMACSLPINLIKFMMKVIEKELGFPKGLNILIRANFLAKIGLFTWNVSITRNVDKLNLINEKMRNFREKDIKIFCNCWHQLTIRVYFYLNSILNISCWSLLKCCGKTTVLVTKIAKYLKSNFVKT